MRTLGELFVYTNEKLLQGELSEIQEVIEFYEECQQKIAVKNPIEAPKLTLTLTSNEVTLPADFLKFRRIRIDGKDIEPEETWAGTLYLPKYYTSGTAELYYYKKPTVLDPTNLEQIPDLDSRYLPSMAQYAAEMYYLIDDDEDMRDAFRDKFFESLTYYGSSKNTVSKFKNLW